MTSFSDVELTLPSDSPNSWDTFPAKHVTTYLENYVDNHIYANRSLRDRIHVDVEVVGIHKIDQTWRVETKGKGRHIYRCAKLAVASGPTSTPVMPEIPQYTSPGIPMHHHKDFGLRSEEILSDSSSKNITVIGGGKSAADLVYASLLAGKHVNWLVRKTGEGPAIFVNPAIDGRYKNRVEAAATQKSAALKPSSFRPMATWAKKIHQSASGRDDLIAKFSADDNEFKLWANYRDREGAKASFRELEPSAS